MSPRRLRASFVSLPGFLAKASRRDCRSSRARAFSRRVRTSLASPFTSCRPRKYPRRRVSGPGARPDLVSGRLGDDCTRGATAPLSAVKLGPVGAAQKYARQNPPPLKERRVVAAICEPRNPCGSPLLPHSRHLRSSASSANRPHGHERQERLAPLARNRSTDVARERAARKGPCRRRIRIVCQPSEFGRDCVAGGPRDRRADSARGR
jgi:hypothetical protein